MLWGGAIPVTRLEAIGEQRQASCDVYIFNHVHNRVYRTSRVLRQLIKKFKPKKTITYILLLVVYYPYTSYYYTILIYLIITLFFPLLCYHRKPTDQFQIGYIHSCWILWLWYTKWYRGCLMVKMVVYQYIDQDPIPVHWSKQASKLVVRCRCVTSYFYLTVNLL